MLPIRTERKSRLADTESMPRTARIPLPVGCLVHVWFRFVDGRFVLDDPGRAEYLRRLVKALRSSGGWVLISYALMSSHVHLLLLVGEVPLGVWIQPAHVGFAQWINGTRREVHPKTLGHVFGERPNDKPIPLERAGVEIAYHHNNPIEAGVVMCPSESTWTSHRAYVGAATPIPGLDVSRGLELSGFADDPDGFHRFVVSRRKALPNDRHARQAVEVARRAARVTAAPLDEVLHGSRTRAAARARRLAIGVWSRLGRSAASLASHVGVSASAAARAQKALSVDDWAAVEHLVSGLDDSWI